MNYKDEYKRWLDSPTVSKADKEELRALSEDEVRERFSAELEFGTAGIRRVMEVGPGSMNSYTVKHVTRALGMYLTGDKDNANPQKQYSVVIACDSRNNSQRFAEEAACVLAAQGIHVFLFEDLRPTPELSFAVRYAGASAGINITASHNTKEYNGYKVYGSDGAQLSPEHADEVARIISETDVLDEPESMDLDEAVKNSVVELIDGYVDNMYLAQVMQQSRIVSEAAKTKIVYTAFHGTGYKFVPEVLKRDGFENVYCVEPQCIPDGDFPTVKSPNPENEESFKMAIELAASVCADLIIGTDPDGDRCGVAIPVSNVQSAQSLDREEVGMTVQDSQAAQEAPEPSRKYRVLTGNQVGVLILDYLIKMRSIERRNLDTHDLEKSSSDATKRPYAAKSIVSTNMANRICEKHGVEMVETLTGFKFIGEKMEELSVGQGREFVFGFEESNGYLTGLYARDKDSIVAALLVAETAAYHAANGRTMEQALAALYEEYGYYLEKVVSKGFDGLDGAAEMQAFMDNYRQNPPSKIAGLPVITIRDYLSGEIKEIVGSPIATEDSDTSIYTDASADAGIRVRPTGLPKSNVLFYELAGGSSFVVRPSGTEPKIKFYLSAVGATRSEAEAVLAALESAI